MCPTPPAFISHHHRKPRIRELAYEAPISNAIRPRTSCALAAVETSFESLRQWHRVRASGALAAFETLAIPARSQNHDAPASSRCGETPHDPRVIVTPARSTLPSSAAQRAAVPLRRHEDLRTRRRLRSTQTETRTAHGAGSSCRSTGAPAKARAGTRARAHRHPGTPAIAAACGGRHTGGGQARRRELAACALSVAVTRVFLLEDVSEVRLLEGDLTALLCFFGARVHFWFLHCRIDWHLDIHLSESLSILTLRSHRPRRCACGKRMQTAEEKPPAAWDSLCPLYDTQRDDQMPLRAFISQSTNFSHFIRKSPISLSKLAILQYSMILRSVVDVDGGVGVDMEGEGGECEVFSEGGSGARAVSAHDDFCSRVRLRIGRSSLYTATCSPRIA
ncbi:putative laccase 10 [Mycena sanguinolenta]|uniref:Putative laccase 10 n=1 Tax=Mycena sanguinolenta TaxID=230812 RepID=A0A8H7D6K9_9AGAR|nr:putative laccase 10 [Mycena sanguinolenta]